MFGVKCLGGKSGGQFGGKNLRTIGKNLGSKVGSKLWGKKLGVKSRGYMLVINLRVHKFGEHFGD